MAKTFWKIDPAHSQIGFKVKYMLFTNVSGRFNDFEASIENEDDQLETSKIFFSGQVDSIDTNNIDRDSHLKSSDFFDGERFPRISFQSTRINKIEENQYQILGNLTIKDFTKNITLDVNYSGLMQDPWGNTRIGVSLSGKINRNDFGLNWNASLEAGGVLVGETVNLIADVQLIKS